MATDSASGGETPPSHGLPPPVTGGGAAPLRDQNVGILFAAVETTRMPMIVTDPNRPEADVAELARTILEDFGYTVRTATNGVEALEALGAGARVDMLVTDLIMPGGMNGVVLAREARKRQPKIKVLLTTGHAESSIERTDIDGSGFDMVGKPCRRTELVRRVRMVLDGPTGVG